MLPPERLAIYPRLIVELGMGDGRVLESLARSDTQSLFVGIEIDAALCDAARSRISSRNVLVVNGSIEDIVPALQDGSVDTFVAVLPDPAFIDRDRRTSWEQVYAQIYRKLKAGGMLQLVTELTDELLQPVDAGKYREWVLWLELTFESLGYITDGVTDGAPAEYSSRCLDQFRGDPERIRLVTMSFTKPFSHEPHASPAVR
jgi:tRNA G46 methylase TrmB